MSVTEVFIVALVVIFLLRVGWMNKLVQAVKAAVANGTLP